EAVILIGLVLLSAPGIIAMATVANVGVQIWRRRPLLKATFNVAVVTVATACAAGVAELFSTDVSSIDPLRLAGAVVGVTVYIAVNSGLFSLMLNAAAAKQLGPTWRHGLSTRSLLFASALALGA